MNDQRNQHSDPQLRFLRQLVDENATIAGDVAEVGTDTWAIHGVIPVDGDVLMVEFPTYDQARNALDHLGGGSRWTTGR